MTVYELKYSKKLIEEVFENEKECKGLVNNKEFTKMIDDALSTLPSRTKHILISYYNGIKTDVLAQKYNISKSRICSIRRKGIRLLRRALTVNNINERFKNKAEKEANANTAKRKKTEDFYNLHFSILVDRLDNRTYNCIVRSSSSIRNGPKYKTIGDIAFATDEELLKINGLGAKSLQCIREAIAYYKEKYNVTDENENKYFEQQALQKRLVKKYSEQMNNAKNVINLLIKCADNTSVENRAIVEAAQNAIKALA